MLNVIIQTISRVGKMEIIFVTVDLWLERLIS